MLIVWAALLAGAIVLDPSILAGAGGRAPNGLAAPLSAPDGSLVLQPFIATGAFGPAMEFARPRSFEFLTYGKDVGVIQNGRIYPNGTGTGAVSFAVPQPDFNVGSLRGNAVVRWEWRPGSTMYFAWQQTRSDFTPTARSTP